MLQGIAWLFLLAGCGSETTPSGSERLASSQTASPQMALQQRLPVRPDVNVIVISFDALRADALGVYGYSRPTSPRLDAFAAKSTLFERAYTVAPVTPTSFAAAFTGLLPHRVFHRWNLVHQDTLAVRFAANGYATAAFINNVQLTEERSFDIGFDVYELNKSLQDEETLESSLAWLEQNRQHKLFAWIHFLDPHSPYVYRDSSAHLYDADYEGAFETTTRGSFDTDDPLEIARIRDLYDGEVLYVDAIFGRLIDGLSEMGLLENSIIVVTSDHGEEFKEHGGFQHDRLTEEHVRIPLLLYHPDAPGSARTEILVSNVDFYPTFLSLAGIPSDGVLDGRDWTRLTTEPDWVAGVSMTGGQERWLSLRTGDHKLILTCMPEHSLTLYDLAADPGELRDLQTELPAVTKTLHRDLGVVMGGEPCSMMQAAVQGVSPTVGLSAENIEALKALGYLGD